MRRLLLASEDVAHYRTVPYVRILRQAGQHGEVVQRGRPTRRAIQYAVRSVPHAAPDQGHAALELQICTHKTCRKQGAQQVLKFAQDLALPGVRVQSTGCLGNCGAGPNLVVLPQGLKLRHVGTPAALAEALRSLCGCDAVTPAVLQATQLRLAGNSLATEGRLDEALAAYDSALALGVALGRHLVLSNRSAVLLQLGRKGEALADAQACLAAAPPDFLNGWLRAIDSHYALGQHTEAAECTRKACAAVPGFQGSKQHQAIVQALSRAGVEV